jgi:hypothetical protein
MKTIYKTLLYTLLTCSLTACNNYLNSDSADLLIPKSLEDYSPLLLGQGYPDSYGGQLPAVCLMTDDVEMGPLYYGTAQLNDRYATNYMHDIDPAAGNGIYAHIWTKDYSEYISDSFWDGRYANILTCNTIIEALPTMTYSESQAPMYRKLAAQAYALRAYNYFCLVNTYALPYSEANLSKPGVILKTTPEISTKSMARSTIKETYALINDDIKKAQEYLEGANTQASKFEITPAAIYFLAARIALFQNDWDGVIAAADKFFKINKSILDLNSIDATLMGITSSYNSKCFTINDIDYDEVVFAFGRSTYYYDSMSNLAPRLLYAYYDYGFHTSWTGDNSLIKLYDSDDLRLKAYFLTPCLKTGTRRNPQYIAGQYHPIKCDNYASRTKYASQCWRTPEVYLDLAEAYAQKSSGVSEEAIDLLNQLRAKKYTTGSANATKKASDFASKDDLIKFIWQERRRELCFEELTRFWDMRRQGMPSQTHYFYTSKTQYTTYTLNQGSPNYVLPIPQSELKYNDAAVDNDRETVAASSNN